MNQIINIHDWNLLKNYYENVEENADIPFPNEETLGITVTEGQITALKVGSELTSFIDESGNDSEYIPAVIRMVFPEDYGTVLALSRYLPQKLIEACLLKVRNYLIQYGNKEYALNKLTIQLPGKEPTMKNVFNRILTRPLECRAVIAEGGEFSYLFWAHLCALIKNDIKQRQDRYGYDNTIIQAVYIIEALNAYYKSVAVRAKEKELAFKNLEEHLAQPPYIYSLDQIMKFTNAKGVSLVGMYSKEELSEYLINKAGKSVNNVLPDLLILPGTKTQRNFILKSKLPLFCSKLLSEGREKVKKVLFKHWFSLLKCYQNEAAMDDDQEFEKMLARLAQKVCPMLYALLEDPKLQMVYDEIGRELAASSRIFIDGSRMSYSSLFLLKRSDLLEDIRLYLPFWYSIPFVVATIAFIKKLDRKYFKKEIAANGTGDFPVENLPSAKIYNYPATISDGSRYVMNAAKDIEQALVPIPYTIDSYLEELKRRWSKLVDRQSRENMIRDVNFLIQDSLRETLRSKKDYQITRENITQLAFTIFYRVPSLQTTGASDALREYIELFLIKLLETLRFDFLQKMKRPA